MNDKKRLRVWFESIVDLERWRLNESTRCDFLIQKPQPPEVFVGPADVLNHAHQCFDGERVAQLVIRYDDTAAVRMAENSMTTTCAYMLESFTLQCLDENTG